MTLTNRVINDVHQRLLNLLRPVYAFNPPILYRLNSGLIVGSDKSVLNKPATDLDFAFIRMGDDVYLKCTPSLNHFDIHVCIECGDEQYADVLAYTKGFTYHSKPSPDVTELHAYLNLMLSILRMYGTAYPFMKRVNQHVTEDIRCGIGIDDATLSVVLDGEYVTVDLTDINSVHVIAKAKTQWLSGFDLLSLHNMDVPLHLYGYVMFLFWLDSVYTDVHRVLRDGVNTNTPRMLCAYQWFKTIKSIKPQI